MAKRQRRKRQERRQEHARRSGWQTRHSVITGAGIAATAALGIAGSAQAAATNYYVGSTDDTATAVDCDVSSNTDCTLRDAINAANANSGYADSIYFRSTISGTPIVLGSDLPDITESVYIIGNGQSQNTISGDDSYRIFNIHTTNPNDPVVIAGLKLADGYAYSGAAIYNEDANLGVYDSNLTGNTTMHNGGAIYLKGNDPYEGRQNVIAYSTIHGNHAGVDGGGVYSYEFLGTMGTSTIDGNTATNIGGGVSAWRPGFVYSSTISGNSAPIAGGYANKHDVGYLYNSIVAGNAAGFASPDVRGEFYAGFDLFQTTSGATFHPAIFNAGPNLTGVDPQLGALGNNGGDLPTRKPAASSPVVDQGLSKENDDERFFPRPVDNPNVPNAPGGDGGDMGAVELTLAEGPGAAPAPAPPGSTFNLKKAKKKCKKKFPGKRNAKKRKKCIRKAKRKAGVAAASSSPWRQAADRWAKNATHEAFRH